MLKKIIPSQILQNSLKLTEWLLLSILLIPFFKIFVSVLNISVPAYYAPTILIAALMGLKKEFLNYRLLAINAVVVAFIFLGIFHDQGLNASSFKIHIAALVYFNLIYIFFVSLHSTSPENLDTLFERHYRTSLKLSLIFMGICLLSFTINCYLFPFDISIEHLKQYLTFDRVNPNLRGNLLVRFNPVALLKNDITNIRYIGQQLLILPITTFAYSLLFKKRTRLNVLFAILLVISVFLTNSRAMFLTLFAMLAIAYVPRIPKALHIVYCFAAAAFPFSLSFFSADFTSNRLCQINFVKSHATAFGNGLGAYIQQLNEKCGYVIQGQGYQNIVTTSYDNIHIEFIHYFGIIGYAIFLSLFLYSVCRHNNSACRMLVFFITIFLSLNFNLFEILFLPTLTIMSINAYAYRNSLKTT